jgi:release factor glutamine methyltransferase
MDRGAIESRLRVAGCVAADAEAEEIYQVARSDEARLREIVDRRCSGEPLAWLLGSVRFCEESMRIDPGVYVPRWQSEPLALMAVARLPESGAAVDLCTGAGALAVVMARRRPNARVVATEVDPLAVECAVRNGVEVFLGDMTSNVPRELFGFVDVVTGVVPYVPTDELSQLPRDVLEWEPIWSLDGGENGTRLLIQAIVESAALLREGGSLLLELGGDQARFLSPVLEELGYGQVEVLVDEDEDVRGIVCVH